MPKKIELHVSGEYNMHDNIVVQARQKLQDIPGVEVRLHRNSNLCGQGRRMIARLDTGQSFEGPEGICRKVREALGNPVSVFASS